MSFVAAAIIGGGAIAAGGSLLAAQAGAGAANNANAQSQARYQQTVSQQQPYMQGGGNALRQLDYLTGSGTPGNGSTASSSTGGGYGSLLSPFTTANWQELSPAYGFQLQQGAQGAQAGAAPGMGSLSGAAQTGLLNSNQGIASNSFNNAFNMYQTQQGNIYSRLANIANLGQNAAANTGQVGASLAGTAANASIAAGGFNAAGLQSAGNVAGGSLNTAALLNSYGNQSANLNNLGSQYGSLGAGAIDSSGIGNYNPNLTPYVGSGVGP